MQNNFKETNMHVVDYLLHLRKHLKLNLDITHESNKKKKNI